MAPVGLGARVGIHPASVWTNPEPELGAFVNEVVTCDQADPWNFGADALMANLARRGLLAAR
jgi:fumarylacetoacetate (FAA) hydrolase family protein